MSQDYPFLFLELKERKIQLVLVLKFLLTLFRNHKDSKMHFSTTKRWYLQSCSSIPRLSFPSHPLHLCPALVSFLGKCVYFELITFHLLFIIWGYTIYVNVERARIIKLGRNGLEMNIFPFDFFFTKKKEAYLEHFNLLWINDCICSINVIKLPSSRAKLW